MRWHFSARLHPHKGSFEALSSVFHSVILQWTPFITSNSYAVLKCLFFLSESKLVPGQSLFSLCGPVKAKGEAGNQ